MLAWIALLVVRVPAQSLSVAARGDTLRVETRGFGFIKGDTLMRLKDGQSVTVELELSVLASADGPLVARLRHLFILSYDLWEERFAATRSTAGSRTISHLRAADAEAWCIDQMTLPIDALGRWDRKAPVWVRLAYRIVNNDDAAAADDSGVSLRRLIDAFSRNRQIRDISGSVAGGPFRLTD